MNKIEDRIRTCTKCGNYPKPQCNSIKNGNCNIMIIGESPAKNGWLVSNKAFYDTNEKLLETGKVLNKLLSLCGLSIDDIYFTECCKCHISDRTNLEKCSEFCKPFLMEQLTNSNCEYILPMGVFATKIIMNKKIKSFKDYVGKKFEIDFNGQKKIIIPIYHTSPANPLGFKGNVEIFKELVNVK